MSEQLPVEWKITNLSDVVLSISGGGTPSKSQVSYYKGDIPWMTVKDMNKFLLDDTVDHITQEAVENSSTRIIPAGIPIIATRMSLGKIVRAKFDSAINQDLKAIFLHEKISMSYFEYWYRSIAPYIVSIGKGTTVKGVRLEQINELKLPLTPLAEQKQIATKLDELLAQADTIKTRLDAIPTILKRFRQSDLAAAVSGKLTEEWRKNSQISKPKNKELKKVIKSLDQGWSPKCINESADFDEWGVIKTSSVQPLKFISIENKRLPKLLEARPKLSLKKGEILITRAGPRIRCGVTCIVDKDYPGLMICDKVYRIRVDENETIPMFLNLVLNSPQYLDVIEKMKTGISESGMNLTQKKFYQLVACFPELEEQNEIVEKIEKYLTFADQIEKQVNAAQTRVNNLTQSILAKAFRGDLTAKWREQNPDLISGENSAEVLLEKIKAERDALKPAKKSKRKKVA